MDDRNLELEVKKGELIYISKVDPIRPFQSNEGTVLLIDFLDELTNELEK